MFVPVNSGLISNGKCVGVCQPLDGISGPGFFCLYLLLYFYSALAKILENL